MTLIQIKIEIKAYQLVFITASHVFIVGMKSGKDDGHSHEPHIFWSSTK